MLPREYFMQCKCLHMLTAMNNSCARFMRIVH